MRRVGWTALLVIVMSSGVWGQPAAQDVEVDPVSCWWRTAAAAVRVGEPFSLQLTCSGLETDAARAVIDRTRLGPAAVQFPPFEVVGGSQSPDHVTPGRRFMQYDYSLRLIAEDAFGLDVPIPALEITYRIETRVQQDAAAVQGREQTYTLPAIPVRVASLVPQSATDIRESRVPSLNEIAAREFRARLFRVLSFILFGVAGLVVALSVAHWFRHRRAASTGRERRLLPNRAVLAAVRRELRAVQRESRGGWTPEIVGRALAATRVVASYLARHAVSQRAMTAPVAVGELTATAGLVGRRRVAVSGATTTRTLQALGDNTEVVASNLEAALAILTAARYGRDGTLNGGSLDEALSAAMRATDRVASRHTWLAETFASFTQTLRGWRPQAWAR